MSPSVVGELDRIGRDVTAILDRLPPSAIPESSLPHLQHLPRIATALERIAAALETSRPAFDASGAVRTHGAHH